MATAPAARRLGSRRCRCSTPRSRKETRRPEHRLLRPGGAPTSSAATSTPPITTISQASRIDAANGGDPQTELARFPVPAGTSGAEASGAGIRATLRSDAAFMPDRRSPMPFTLPDLPFASDALGAIMSAETLDFHHGKHHRPMSTRSTSWSPTRAWQAPRWSSVIRAAQRAGRQEPVQQRRPALEPQLLLAMPGAARGAAADRPARRDDRRRLRRRPTAARRRSKEEAVGHFASGWAWLVLDRGRLKITSLHDADTPVVARRHEAVADARCLGACLLYRLSQRPAEIRRGVLGNIVNWEFVAQNLDGEGVGRADQQRRRQPRSSAGSRS